MCRTCRVSQLFYPYNIPLNESYWGLFLAAEKSPHPLTHKGFLLTHTQPWETHLKADGAGLSTSVYMMVVLGGVSYK